MNIPFVDLRTQYQTLRPQLLPAMESVMERAAFVLGPELRAFETAFADYLGVRYCLGVASGTDALALALLAFGVGPGDEVITVPNSFIATTEAITRVGAVIRWVDVDCRTGNLDAALLEAAITPRTRAVLPVHLYGQPADMEPIAEVARRHGLALVEDCAQAHGARYQGRRVGTFGQASCFSFYPGKNLGAFGDGGAVVTDDPAVAEQVELLRNHGQRDKYVHVIEGHCHRLDNLQAAVLSIKLPCLDGWNERRRNAAAHYDALLAGVDGVVTPWVLPGVEPVYHLYVAQLPERDRVREFLQARGIETGIHYPIPLHQQPAYARLGHAPEDFPVAARLAPRLLSLPMFPEITTDQIESVVGAIREALRA